MNQFKKIILGCLLTTSILAVAPAFAKPVYASFRNTADQTLYPGQNVTFTTTDINVGKGVKQISLDTFLFTKGGDYYINYGVNSIVNPVFALFFLRQTHEGDSGQIAIVPFTGSDAVILHFEPGDTLQVGATLAGPVLPPSFVDLIASQSDSPVTDTSFLTILRVEE